MLDQYPMNESLYDKKILLVDDERDINNLLEEVLKLDGFRKVYKAFSGSEAVSLCREEKPDVVVLDIMLPDMDGIDVCKKIREFTYCPIIFLSSRNDDIDKILGLSSGGDDYVEKPFSPREMVYRIKAQLRRQQYDCNDRMISKKKITIGDISIDTEGCCVYKGDKEVELTAREFGLLKYLGENLNKIISKERLYEQVWGEDSIGCDNTVMVHIRHIREKIEDDPTNPQILLTAKGLGYRLIKREIK